MASEVWARAPLGELIENFDAVRVPVKESERRTGPYPYYGASGVVDYVDGYIFDGEYLLIAEDGENLRTRQTPIAFLATGQFWVNNHAHIVRANASNDTRFLMYAMRVADIGSYLTGSTMPKLTQANMSRVPVVAPPLAVQREISRFLGALDDKIELNRKTNETLEAMARALFKSWFVDFDPVRAKAEGRAPSGMDAATAALFPSEFVDSALGPIPKGWTVGKIGDVIQIHDSRRIPLSARERQERQGAFPYYGATSVMDYVDNFLFDGRFVLVGEDGSVVTPEGLPFTQYVWGRFWVNNHAHVLTGAADVSQEHLYLLLQRTNITAFVTGAVQAKLSQGNMTKIPLVLAPPSVNANFGVLLGPLFALFRTLVDESLSLARLRDELLPRLLSGDLSVRGAAGVAEGSV